MSLNNKSAAQEAIVQMGEARACLTKGQVSGALHHMDRARGLAMQTDDYQLQADAQSRAGIVFNRARKFDLAFEAIDTAEKICLNAKLPDSVLLKVWANRGSFLMDAGFLHRATETLKIVAKRAGEATEPETRISQLVCLSNLIYICLVTGRAREALLFGEEYLDAEYSAASVLTVENRAFFEGWYSTALAQTGKHAEARQRLATFRDQIPPDAVGSQIQFSIALSVSEVHGGFIDQGVTRLRDTLRLAKDKNLYYAQALQALTLVLEHVGEIAEALQCVQQLEKIFKEDARGIIGIEEEDENRREQENAAAAQREAEHPDHLEDEPSNSSIRLLDDQAARLRIRRFMELTQDERHSVLDRIAVASALVDDETGKHCARVELLTFEFCRALHFPERRARLISQAARMHDLGKLGIPHRVLLAPRKLTPMEFEIAKKHVPIGADILSFSNHEVVKMARIIAENHHEKWNGTGYPGRKFEDATPIEARITSIVDVFDVLTHKRVYKRAWSVEQARDEIAFMGERGDFDPALVDVFLTQVVKPDYVIPTEFPNEPSTPYDVRSPTELAMDEARRQAQKR
jgi:HD-GYP domain-containing protein (c-di-GMP phosphodiesterase class II)